MYGIDITGQTFWRWTVLRRVENTPRSEAQWLCRCICGTERVLKSIVVRRGMSKSCGCLKREQTIARSTKHGHASNGYISPTYHTWSGMMSRCGNPDHRSYCRYGARGVTVCKEWHTFAGFLADMGEKPPGMSLDRFPDKHGNYEPGNCRWATPKQQSRNKSNNRIITLNGEKKTLIEWAEALGITQSSLRERLEKWPLEKALSA